MRRINSCVATWRQTALFWTGLTIMWCVPTGMSQQRENPELLSLIEERNVRVKGTLQDACSTASQVLKTFGILIHPRQVEQSIQMSLIFAGCPETHSSVAADHLEERLAILKEVRGENSELVFEVKVRAFSNVVPKARKSKQANVEAEMKSVCIVADIVFHASAVTKFDSRVFFGFSKGSDMF